MNVWEYIADSKQADLEARGLTLKPEQKFNRHGWYCALSLDKIGNPMDVLEYPHMAIVPLQMNLFK